MGRSRRGRVASSGGASSVVGEGASMAKICICICMAKRNLSLSLSHTTALQLGAPTL